ncbi:MAG: hypothetical protein KAR42_03155 [candidate division Zixibacteria bacterium]|nr:hypothetical protein [candidate division Zixibacteria bacterium]
MKYKANIFRFLLILIAFLFVTDTVLADKQGAMKRRKAAQVDKYDEILKMEWPAKAKWASSGIHNSGNNTIEFFYPQGQSSSSWTEMGSIEIKPLTKTVNLTGLGRMIFLGTKESSPGTEWKILYKGKDDNDFSYIVFEIICPDFISGEKPQTQYWKMIHGFQFLFTVQYSYKDIDVPDEFQLPILEAINNASVKLVEKKIESESDKKE